MKNSGTTYDQADSWLSGEVPVCGRGVRSGLFVAEGDEADAQFEAFFGDLDDGDADETEDYSDA